MPIPVSLLIAAYRAGCFPMAMDDGEIQWFSPDPRGILPIQGFHPSRRLLRLARSGRFTTTVNQAFDEVIAACAANRDEGTWISCDIVQSYTELHRLGHAYSVETWHDGRLVGGLYGVSLGGAFFGESMFHLETDASKLALVALIGRLTDRGYGLLDVQWLTPHLQTLGAVEIPRSRYLRALATSLRLACSFV